MLKRMRGGEMSGGDIGSQQISAGLVPRGEPRYYTTYLTNKDAEDTGAHGEVALFEEMRTTNLLARTSAYQVAVERASVDTKALPSFIAQVDTTSTNPNQLQPLVGFELNWTGSLFPSTFFGSFIPGNDGGYLAIGGSSLPIKYSLSSSGGDNTSLTTGRVTNPAVCGVLEAYAENNPNSSFWLGQYSFNPASEVLVASFQRALDRAFGCWKEKGAMYLQMSPNNPYWNAGISFPPQKQILMYSVTNDGTPDAEFEAALARTFNGFYPILDTYLDGSGNTVQGIGMTEVQRKLCQAYMAKYGSLALVCNYSFLNYSDINTTNMIPQVAYVYKPVGVPGTTLPICPQDADANVDNYAILQFRNSSYQATVSQSIPCFDFYPTMTYSNVAQTNSGTITLAPRSMKSPFVEDKPSRDDYLSTALFLGFLPDTIFPMPMANGEAGIYFANRPVAPTYTMRLGLAAYQNLLWKPNDEYVDVRNPKPGSPYYYGYGTSEYLTNTVNPSIANCFQNTNDDEFETGQLPADVLETLRLTRNVTAITDLSLSAQLYCIAYYNSCSAPVPAIQAIQDWNSGQFYAAGSPVTFVNKDPSSPIRNLYIANTASSSSDPQEPIPFKNSEYWLYCGPFLYNTAVDGAKYMGKELLTYEGGCYSTDFGVTPNNEYQHSGIWNPPIETHTNTATGGVITTSGDYTIHTFNSTGEFTVTSEFPVACEVVMMAGGGGGGCGYDAGGGGAGGYYHNTLDFKVGTTSIIVGNGGPGGTWPARTSGTNGEDTVIDPHTIPPYTVYGGGGGGAYQQPGLQGGCGGGGGAPFFPGGAGTNQYSGGTAGDGYNPGGGGGGGTGSNGEPNNGGQGITLTLQDENVYLGGGGGGGNETIGGQGFQGGGNGGGVNQPGANGSANTGGGGGGGGGGGAPVYGGDGGSGFVRIAYLTITPGTQPNLWSLIGTTANGNNLTFNKLKPTPVIGTSPPVMTLNTNPGDGGDVFELRCDTYGFGTLDSDKPTDPLRAFVRDSWGCLNSDPRSFNTNRIYDEFLIFESNTAFRDQFRGFSTHCKKYTDIVTGVSSAYWVYQLVNDPSSVVQPPMPPMWDDAPIDNREPDGYLGGNGRLLGSRVIGNDNTLVSSIKALRNSDPTVYYWTFTSSETSRYCGWSPVQSIVIEGQTVPIDAAHLPVSQPIVVGETQPAYGESRMIIAEFFPKVTPGEGTALYEPQFPRQVFLSQSTDLKYFSYKLSWRNKFTGELVPLLLSQNGAALIVFMFTPKD